ncbi:MAG: biopolymer transporter ExbD [Prevotella sp.]|nr:biopolymer transporter ExbD [Prevotella sp.]
MRFVRKRRRVPGINTASIADISFTLLILFLVVTSMDDDNGMSRMLPPLATEQQPTAMSQRNVLRIVVSPNNDITINDDTVSVETLRERVAEFVDNPNNDPNLPEKVERDIYPLGKCMVTENHVVQIEADRESDYNTYFSIQHEIVAAYAQLRDSLAMHRFQKHYAQCSEEQRMALRKYYPQKVSENFVAKGGKP